MGNRDRVVIVGAGIAGLAAAHALKKAGIEVIVLERRPFVGGRMSSEQFDGFIIDRGAYALSGYATQTLALAEELGVAARLSTITSWSGLFYKRRIHRYRTDSMLSMARGVGLSPSDMVAMAIVLREAKRQAEHLKLHAPDDTTFALEEESAADYALLMGGDKLLERVAYPMMSTLYISDPEHTSKASFLATILYTMGLRLLNSAAGIGFLCEALAGGLDVRLDTDVQFCRLVDGGVEVETSNSEGSGTLKADAVVSTAVAPMAASILEGAVGQSVADALREVAYTPCVPVALALDSRVVDDTPFLVNFPRREFKRLAAVTTEQNKCPGRVPEGRGLLMALPTAGASGELLEMDDDEVVRLVLEDVEKLYPKVSGHVDFARVYRWEHACSQLRPGDLRRRAALRAVLPRSGPVFFAGDYLVSSSSIEGSLISGRQAARRVADYLRTG